MGVSGPPPERISHEKRVSYSAPGLKWKKENTAKLALLPRLRATLTDANLLHPQMSFKWVMECVDLSTLQSDFNTRVLVYLVALTLKHKLGKRYAKIILRESCVQNLPGIRMPLISTEPKERV